MTEGERRARKRACERCGRTWLAFGRRGERCVWCLPSIAEDDELRLSVDERRIAQAIRVRRAGGRVGRVGRPERRDLVRLSRYLTYEMGSWGMLAVEQGRESGRLMGRIRAEARGVVGGGRD